MRFLRTVIFILFVAFMCSPGAQASMQQPERNSSAEQSVITPFLGRWDVTLNTPGHAYGSWLELTESGGQLEGRMVGRWGHAHPLLNVQVHDEKLTFSSPKKEEASAEDLPFQGKLIGGRLIGTASGPHGSVWTWVGERAPLLGRTTAKSWGKPIRLFNGKNMQGWWFNKPETANTWSVKDGVLISTASGSDIITRKKFKDFKLHVEFNCAANCNSGVYLRGRYEVQVTDATGRVPPNRRGGAVYGFLAPSSEIPITPGTWQTFDITLIGRTVTVVQDGHTVIDHQQIPGVTGGALDSHEGLPGPIYLQGSEKAGSASFRNITIVPAVE